MYVRTYLSVMQRGQRGGEGRGGSRIAQLFGVGLCVLCLAAGSGQRVGRRGGLAASCVHMSCIPRLGDGPLAGIADREMRVHLPSTYSHCDRDPARWEDGGER